MLGSAATMNGCQCVPKCIQVLVLPVQTVLEAGGSFAGVNRKVQLKPTKWSEPEEGSTEPPHLVEALLILKHGGVLTHAGRQQACAISSPMLNVPAQLRFKNDQPMHQHRSLPPTVLMIESLADIP